MKKYIFLVIVIAVSCAKPLPVIDLETAKNLAFLSKIENVGMYEVRWEKGQKHCQATLQIAYTSNEPLLGLWERHNHTKSSFYLPPYGCK